MRRARSMPGNRLSTSCHLQQPVSPLRAVRKRDQPVSFFEENPPNKKARGSAELLDCDTSESPDSCSGSVSEASVYEDCQSELDSDSYYSSDTSSDSDESDFVVPEKIEDDKAWTDIERKLMAKVRRLQTSYDNLLLQASLGDNPPIHAHVMNLLRQRDEVRKENRKSRVMENQLLHRVAELLSRITQLELEKDNLKEDKDLLEHRNASLVASNDALQDNLRAILGRLAIVAADLRDNL